MKIESGDHQPGTGQLRRSLSIAASPAALLQAWRKPSVQQQVLGHVASLLSGDEQAMRWKIELPLDRNVEVESHETEFVADERVRYASTTRDGPQVQLVTEMSVRPAPADFGTVATISVDYSLPGGALAETAMKLAGSAPDLLAAKALRRFKALIETGEIPTLERNPSARDSPNGES